MSLLEKYRNWAYADEPVEVSPAERAAFEIVKDLTGRSGFEDMWEDTEDRNPEIIEGMLQKWVLKIEEAFS